MKKQMSAALALSVASLLAGASHASELAQAQATSNLPPGAGEASTMTNGVPNLLASNVQPGELGTEGRLTLRRTSVPAYGGDPGLKLMGGPGLMRPVLIAPPEPAR